MEINFFLDSQQIKFENLTSEVGVSIENPEEIEETSSRDSDEANLEEIDEFEDEEDDEDEFKIRADSEENDSRGKSLISGSSRGSEVLINEI